MRKTLKAVIGLCVALVAVLGMSSAAGAQGLDDYFPDDELTFEYPAEVSSGGDIAITGNCTLAEDVTFTIGGEEIGSVTPDENGDFSATFDVPTLDAGTYTIQGTCGDLVAEGDIEVLAAGSTPTNTPTTSGSAPLARTGFQPLPVVTLGAAALVLGGAAVYGSKRRRATA